MDLDSSSNGPSHRPRPSTNFFFDHAIGRRKISTTCGRRGGQNLGPPFVFFLASLRWRPPGAGERSPTLTAGRRMHDFVEEGWSETGSGHVKLIKPAAALIQSGRLWQDKYTHPSHYHLLASRIGGAEMDVGTAWFHGGLAAFVRNTYGQSPFGRSFPLHSPYWIYLRRRELICRIP